MVVGQDFLYWSLIEELVIRHKYNILMISQDGTEILLEPVRKSSFSIIRLKRVDLDWGNQLAFDIHKASEMFEQLTKSGVRGSINVLNIYISFFKPVDDLPEAFQNGLTKKKVSITSLLLVNDEKEEGITNLKEALNLPLDSKMLSRSDVNLDEVYELRKRVLAFHTQQREEERKLFQNGKPFFTYIFLTIQIIMFIILELFGSSSNSETLIRFGAKYNPLIFEGEWWRFMTPILLHIGFLHLLMNSFALYYIGPAVERAYGSMRFLVIYIVAGVSGSIVSFAFNPGLSAGASGAIFGCFGALLYIGVQNRKVFLRTMGSNLLLVVGINLALGFVIPNIDNAGHIGGLVGGFLAATIVQFPKNKHTFLRITGTIILSCLLIAIYLYGMKQADEHYWQYVALQGQELINDQKFEEAYHLLRDAIDNDIESNDLLFLLSVTEIELGRYDQAMSHLHMVIANDKTYHQAYFNLAILYLNGGNKQLALEFVNKALEISPSNERYNSFKKTIIQ